MTYITSSIWHGIVVDGRCEDSLELDLFLLQCCSVMAPPEEFVERIQARFGLTDYFSLVLQCPNEYGISNSNDSQGPLFCTLECEAQVCNRLQGVKCIGGYFWGCRYEPILAQEFLALLIRLVSERGFCGLTMIEALRRELVQRLAVGDSTHSALLKALPPRLQDSKEVQECLDAVAKFCNPSGIQQVC